MTVSVRARGAASVLAFSHLLGFGRPAKSSAKAEDDDRKDDPDAEDGDEDETDEKKDSKKSKKAKAEDDDNKDDPDAEDGDDEETDEKKDSKKAKKAKAEDDETCDDDDEDYASARRAGRQAERDRWAKVLSHPASGQGRVAAACQLLSTSNLGASAIIGALDALPASGARGSSLDQRMQGARPPNPGPDGGAEPSDASAMAKQIVSLGRQRRGEK